jgi:hypothetical protein
MRTQITVHNADLNKKSYIFAVSVVSVYGLDDWAIEVRSPAEAKGFFLLASVSRPALRPTQPSVQWAPGVLSRG